MSATAFPRDLFDDIVLALGGGIDFVTEDGTPSLRIYLRPPRIELGQGTCRVTITLDDGEPRSTARTDEEQALVVRMIALLRASVAEAHVYKAKRVAEFERYPLHASTTFGRVEFDALIHSLGKVVDMTDLRIGDATATVARGAWDRVARITLRRGGQEVSIYSLDDTLRTTATTDAERAFVDELGVRVQAVVDERARERERQIERAIASAPVVDREILVEALAALTHGRVDVQPIADAILLATTDPRRYVTENALRLRSFGIDAPVEGLYVVALLSHIPRAHLAYFDWKDSTHDMLPVIADVLRAGPGVELDVERFRARCDKWDRSRERLPALEELASEIAGAALVELRQNGDAYAIACVRTEALPRLRAWATKAHVPLRSLVTTPRAKPGAKALEKTLAQATDVKPYAVTTRFAPGEIVEHPKFGRGQVVSVLDNKVVLRFGDGERTLLHGKT